MSEVSASSAKYIVLCLGLLIGFVVGFVLLLASLPIKEGVDGYDAYASRSETSNNQEFDFYKYLPSSGKKAQPSPKTEVRAEPVVVSSEIVHAEPAPADPVTRVVPANAQILPQQQKPLVAKGSEYAEVPAAYHGESYYLQAGRFVEQQQAQAMRAQVLLLGLDAFIITRTEADGATAHRVRVGPYFDQNILTEAKKRLRRGGINYEIVRVTG